MGVAFLSGYSPVAHRRFGVALVRRVLALHFGCSIVGLDGGQVGHLGQFPCGRSIGNIGIGEQHHRGEVLEGYLGSHEGSVEAVGGAGGGYDGHGALTVSAIQHL